MLQKGAQSSNECYKKGQRVESNLGDCSESGGNSSCTGKDMLEGLCVDHFDEYESKALFCSAAQISDLSCSDAALSQLAIRIINYQLLL